MFKNTLTSFFAGALLVVSSHGALITYDFSNNDLSASVTGTGVNSSDLTVQLQSGHGGGTNAIVYSVSTGAGPGSGNDRYLFATDQVGVGGNESGNGATRLHTDGGFSLTISPDAGQVLDFSTASFTVDTGGFVNVNPNLTTSVGLFYQINSGSILAIDDGILGGNITGNSGSDVYTTTGDALLLTNGAFGTNVNELGTPLSLSAISGLSADDTVSFFVTFGTNRSDDQTSYAFAADDIVFSSVNATAVPEPSSVTLLTVAFAGLCLLRRRRGCSLR